jgi:hypothetical protein
MTSPLSFSFQRDKGIGFHKRVLQEPFYEKGGFTTPSLGESPISCFLIYIGIIDYPSTRKACTRADPQGLSHNIFRHY